LDQPLNTRDTVQFIVTNTGTFADTYTFSCPVTDGLTCVSVSPSSATIQPDLFKKVTVIYDVGSSGGDVRLTAFGHATDTGWMTINGVTPGTSTIALKNFNGDHQDRGLCLTTGGGEATAVQCGDLLVAHAMPGYQTMGRDRSLTLVYNSATAAPRPVVAVWVTLPTTVAQPDSVYAELQIAGIKRASAWYTSWGGTNRVRQIVLAAPFDTVSGLYPFTLIVRNQYSTGPYDATQTGSLLVVNRKTSEFGAGWWLAGVEQIVTGQSGNKILWLGGDGSAAVYDSIGPGVWRRALGGFRDSLVRFDSSGTWYRRTLRHRVKVTYNSAGRHIRTTNRLLHSTTFTWGNDTLRTITVPPAGQSATTYTVAYVAGTKLLDKITDPAGRVLDATVTAGNLTGLIDPDGIGVSFGYDATRRVTGRTNRRGYATNYVYANGLRVTRVEVPLSSQADLGITNVTHWDEQGLAVGNVVGRLTPADTSLVYTQVDGPRTDAADIAKFWVDRWGAPVRIRDPLGFETTLTRGDGKNPALLTRAQFPDGRILGAGYDSSRANPTFVADSTHEGTGSIQTVVSTYLYANSSVPDGPTEVRTPGDTTRIKYDTMLGLPDTAIAPNGHRTRFEYYATATKKGLLYRVTELSVAVVDTTNWLKSPQPLATTLTYDTWGNDSTLTTPTGRQTLYGRDGYRRVASVTDPGAHRTDFAFDSLNRVRSATVTDPGALITRYFYSASSAVDSVLDARQVKRSWEYDAAEQPLRLRDETQATEQRFFSRGGLLDSLTTRVGDKVRNSYNSADQLITTTYPPRVYADTVFNHFIDTIPGDSIARNYDAGGRPLTITRSSSTIIRVYNREGTIRSERQVTRDAGSVVSDVTMLYWYDVAGRRVKFYNGTDTVRYVYGSDGLLSTLAVQWGTGQVPDTFRFYWDALGRRDSLTYSMGTVVHFGYDADGAMRMVCSRHPGNTNNSDYLEQRLRYLVLNADGMVISMSRWAGGTNSPPCGSIPSGATSLSSASFAYDGRHQVIQTEAMRYDYDGSGNRIARRNLSSVLLDSLAYPTRSNRISQKFDSGQVVKNYFYSPEGALVREVSLALGGADRLYYYNPLGEVTGHRAFVGTYSPGGEIWQWVGGSNLCRYDALGRRTRSCSGGWLAFDGENVVRMKGAPATPTWRYIHGPGLDDPLVAIYAPPDGSYRKHYYLTDGGGRHLAFTDSVGTNFMEPVTVGGSPYLTYYQNGGNQAGSVENSHGFDNERGGSLSAPQLSYYRNRYYDQRTGRFIQEDPIGIAGGTNLYQYGANNPASYTDPFGLTLCFANGEANPAFGTLERSTGTEIQLDSEGCATGFERTDKSRQFAMGVWLLRTIIEAPDTVFVNASGHYGFDNHTATLFLSTGDARNYTGYAKCTGLGAFLRSATRIPLETEDETAATTHELRHAADYAVGLITRQTNSAINSPERQRGEARAVAAEDHYNRAAGRRLRCFYDN
jgi:RHS repeat-associated protein